MASKRSVLREIDEAFVGTLKPARFHPDDGDLEGEEHEELLQSRSPETITQHDLRSTWDPLTGACPQGLAYYFPALVRFALAEESDPLEWYAQQLLFHLTVGEQDNELFNYCTPEQRHAIRYFLRHVKENYQQWIKQCSMEEELSDALALWRCQK